MLIKNTSDEQRIVVAPRNPGQDSIPPRKNKKRGSEGLHCDSILHIIYWPALKDTESGKTHK